MQYRTTACHAARHRLLWHGPPLTRSAALPPPPPPPPQGENIDTNVFQVKQRLKAIFARLPPIHAVPRNQTVFLTFTNGHYSELMLNSLATIAALEMPAFVYCFDKAAVELCKEYNIPYFSADEDRMFESADFRQDRAAFLRMGVHKPEMVYMSSPNP